MSSAYPLPAGIRQSADMVSDGFNTVFPVPFYFLDPIDVQVFQKPVGAVVWTLVPPVFYSVTGAGLAAGGSVTLFVQLPAGVRVRTKGRRAPRRTTDVVNDGVVLKRALEQELDAGELTAQELRRDIDEFEVWQAAALPNTLLGFDLGGAPIAFPVLETSAGLAAASAAASAASALVSGTYALVAGAAAQILTFADRASFLAAAALPGANALFAAVNYVHVLDVDLRYSRGGLALATYVYNGVTLTIYKQISAGGVYWTPLYSRRPVKIAQFFPPAGATFSRQACLVNGTANGSNVVTGLALTGYVPVAGWNAASINWASLGGAALAPGATVTAYSPGVSVTLSAALAAGPVKLVVWDDTITGVDAQPDWQAAIDFALSNGLNDLEAPAGRFRFDNTLQAGYGETFNTVRIRSGFRGWGAGVGGTEIYLTKFDRPGINFQGARSSMLQGVNGIGRNMNYAVWGQGYNNNMSSNEADWLAPHYTKSGANPGGLQRYAPFAFVTTDAVAGAAPAHPYPADAFPPPPWSPSLSVYNRNLSSAVLLSEVSMNGCAVGRCISPNQDLQNDYMRLRDFQSEGCVYVDAIGPSQSRNVEMVSGDVARFHTLQSNVRFGSQTGTLGGVLSNITGGNNYQIFDYNLGNAEGPITQSIYIENGKRIGKIRGGNGAAPNFTLSGNLLLAEFSHGEIPDCYIDTDNNTVIHLQNLTIQAGYRIVPLVNAAASLVIGGGFYFGGYGLDGNAAQQLARGFVGGGIYLGQSRFNTDNRDRTIISGFTAVVDQYLSAKVVSDAVAFAGAREPHTQFYNTFFDDQNRKWRLTKPTIGSINISTVAGYTTGALVISNDMIYFTYLGVFQDHPDPAYHLHPGALLHYIPNNTLYLVEALGSIGANYSIAARQMNRLRILNNTFVANLNPDTALNGSMLIVRTNAVLPKRVHYGTFASGTTGVSGISKGDGAAGDLSTYIQNGDILQGLPFGAPIYGSPITSVVTVSGVTNGSPGSLTISGNAIQSGVFPIYPLPITPA